jgi:hypothetical protein
VGELDRRTMVALLVLLIGCGREGFEPAGADEGERYDETLGAAFPPLVLHLPFDEGTGTSAADASGNAHDAALSGVTFAAGHTGQALRFDGVDDYATLTDNPTLGLAAFSIAFWLWSDHGNDFETLITNDHNCVQYESVYVQTGQFGITPTNAASPGATVVDFPPPPAGTWTHVVAVYSGTDLRVYENGALATVPTPTTVAPWPSTHALWLGATPHSCPDPTVVWPFAGLLDDLRVYSGALSDESIAALAQ